MCATGIIISAKMRRLFLVCAMYGGEAPDIAWGSLYNTIRAILCTQKSFYNFIFYHFSFFPFSFVVSYLINLFVSVLFLQLNIDHDANNEKEEEVAAAVAGLIADNDHLLPVQEELKVDTTNIDDDDDDMASQLNANAPEFVPSSPTNSGPNSPNADIMSPPQNEITDFVVAHQPNSQMSTIKKEDRILAQSPRKNGAVTMDNVTVPDETEFDKEILERPHDWSDELTEDGQTAMNGNGASLNGNIEKGVVDAEEDDSEALNSKEERDLDEEKEDVIAEVGDDKIREIFDRLVPGEEDPMNMSFHQDINAPSTLEPVVDLNAVHMIPSDAEEELEKPESEQQQNQHQQSDVAAQVVGLAEEIADHLNLDERPESDLEAADRMELTESESNFYMQEPALEEPEPKEFDEKEEIDIEMAAQHESTKHETPPSTPVVENGKLNGNAEHMIPIQSTSPEPQQLMDAVEKYAEQPQVVVESEPVVIESKPDVEPVAEETKPVESAAAVAIVGAVAATAAAVVATKSSPAPKKAAPTTLSTKKDATVAKTKVSSTKASPTPASRTVPKASASTSSPKTPTTPRAPSKPIASAAQSPRPKTTPTAAAKTPTTTARTPLIEKKSVSATTAAATKRPTPTKSLTSPSPRSAMSTLSSRLSATAKPAPTAGSGLAKTAAPTTLTAKRSAPTSTAASTR